MAIVYIRPLPKKIVYYYIGTALSVLLMYIFILLSYNSNFMMLEFTYYTREDHAPMAIVYIRLFLTKIVYCIFATSPTPALNQCFKFQYQVTKTLPVQHIHTTTQGTQMKPAQHLCYVLVWKHTVFWIVSIPVQLISFGTGSS